VAGRVTAADPGRHLLDRIGAREEALAGEAGDVQARIDELTARLREVSQEISDLQVTRKTLLSLASQDDGQLADEPADPTPVLPDHPAYQQILTAFADLRRPLRARDLCLAPGPADRVQEHREHPLQAKTARQPRHPRRDRTRPVRPAAPLARPTGL
jgi:hypothetical protein